ncbi:MAG: hypothetical protein RSC33_06730, partial [Vagococcus sp.]
NVKDVVKNMIRSNPIIQALYVCWEEPARLVMETLEEINRTDIKIFTTDLDFEIARDLASGKQVIALSTQQPYEQGRAMALATLYSFIDKKVPSFLSIDPILINNSNLEKTWETVTKEKLPPYLYDFLSTKS